jgi:hypothetical protein
MPKSTQKTAGASQPANERGKSRFGASGRAGRVVLPERPPRAVDNEIVSILLGADPASLTEPAGDANSAAPAIPQSLETPPSALIVVEAGAEATVGALVSAVEVPALPIQDLPTPLLPADSHRDGAVKAVDVELIQSKASPEVAPVVAAIAEIAPRNTTRRRDAVRSVPPVSPESAAPLTGVAAAQDGSISSFEEFAERWKHGLRKGQLKLCEVLYQKTYAVGQTECVTSFSELGRLSGLKMRQCFNIIAQLEVLKFVERSRSADTSNKKDQGSVIRFHLFPVQ